MSDGAGPYRKASRPPKSERPLATVTVADLIWFAAPIVSGCFVVACIVIGCVCGLATGGEVFVLGLAVVAVVVMICLLADTAPIWWRLAGRVWRARGRVDNRPKPDQRASKGKSSDGPSS